MRRLGVVVVLSVVILVVGSPIAFVFARRMAATRKPIIVQVEKVRRGDLLETVSAPGEIEPKSRVEISSKAMGLIVAMPYDEGDKVTCGDPNAEPPVPASLLVRLESKTLESQLLSAQASRAALAAQIEVEKARVASQKAGLAGLAASLEQARKDFERQRELLASSDISQAAFDQAKLKVEELASQNAAAQHTMEAAQLNIEVLQHNLDASDAAIAQAEEQLRYTTIRSPIDGVVTRRNSDVGEVVVVGTFNNRGTVIMEIGDLSEMLMVAQVGEADIGKLEVGQRATVHVDAYPDEEFKGVVHSIALAHEMNFAMAKYFRTEILLETNERMLRSGLTAHVDIETRKYTDVLKVPTQAVLGRELDTLPLEVRDKCPEIDPAKSYATVVYRYVDGKAIATPVKIGRSDLTHTIILSGLAEGDKIVVGSYKILENLKHGQPVKDEREAHAPGPTQTRAEDSNDANHVDRS